MAIETVTSGGVGLPATAQLTVPTGVGSWVWGSYVEVVASTAAEYALVGLGIWPNMTYDDLEMAVATGDAGSESDIAVYRLGGAIATNTRAYVFLPHGPIAAGTRLSVRARKKAASSSDQTLRVLMCNTTGIQMTTQVLTVVPSGSASIAVPWGGSAWANGAWVEFIASAASDLVLATLVTATEGFVVLGEVEVDVGIGSAGNEVAVGTWRYHVPTNVGIGIFRLECDPLWDVISSGDRVSLRCRATANVATTYALEVYAKPL